jgi:hypothetical protein
VARHDQGPYRSSSVNSYLVETRVGALLALLVLAGGVVLDVTTEHFWARNALLAGLLSSLIVVVLSAAVFNEAVERRNRRRWSVLAQYVMLELVRQARLVWTSVMEVAGLMAPDATDAASIDAAAQAVHDTDRLKAAIREAVADDAKQRQLHEGVSAFVVHGDQVLGRWAGVMLNANAYAEIIDRHVELASDVAWLESLLDSRHPTDDLVKRRRSAASPAIQIEGDLDDDTLTDRIVAITQLAEGLDRTTLQLALRIVPVEWWTARLGTTVPAVDVGDNAEGDRALARSAQPGP